MKKKTSFLLLGILCLLISGCTTYVGPITEPNFKQFLRKSAQLNKESIILWGRVEWFKGEDAHDFWRWNPKENLISGVIVLQKSKLSVLEWDKQEDKYKTIHKIDYSNIKDVRRRVWGVNQRFVIETKDGTTDAFTITSNSGRVMSIPRTTKALGILREIVELKQNATKVQSYIAIIYKSQESYIQESKESFYECKKSARQGDAKAQFKLGYYYYFGQNVLKDYRKAFAWTKKSAEQGVALSQCLLGVMYYEGIGVLKDPKEAKYWINKAFENGNPNAKVIWKELELWRY